MPEIQITKPHILLFAPSLATTGGVERLVSNLSVLLSERYRVTQCSLDGQGSRLRYQNGLPFVPLAAWRRLPFALRLINYADRALRLRRLKKQLGVDITISNLWPADLVSMVSGGHDRKIALAHVNVVGNPTNRMMIRALPFISRLYRRFNNVISVSEPLNREIRHLYGLEAAKSQCIHNFVRPSTDQVQSDVTTLESRILWCGRLVPEKNPQAAIRIMAEVRKVRPDVQLMMLGDGPLARCVREMCDECGLSVGSDLDDATSAVILPGFVDDTSAWMRRAAFQMLTSSDEGLPMVLIEGLAAGLPALGSDCRSGGIRDAMGGAPASHGRHVEEPTSCGVLLSMPTDAHAVVLWSRWALRLLDDHALRAELSAGSRRRARLFSEDAARTRWFALIDELCAA